MNACKQVVWANLFVTLGSQKLLRRILGRGHMAKYMGHSETTGVSQ